MGLVVGGLPQEVIKPLNMGRGFVLRMNHLNKRLI